jgi:hypothetical protein
MEEEARRAAGPTGIEEEARSSKSLSRQSGKGEKAGRDGKAETAALEPPLEARCAPRIGQG